MHLPKRVKYLFFFIKLAGATFFFYLMFTWLPFPIGEPIEQLIPIDYLWVEDEWTVVRVDPTVDQYLNDAIDEMLGGTGLDSTWEVHGASSTLNERYLKRYDIICSAYDDLCEKVSRLGKFSPREKYWYLASLVSVSRFIQRYAVLGDDIVDTLRKVTVDNSLWNRRGYATWYEVVLNLGSVSSRSEFLQLVAHEFGHIFDLWCIQWTSSRKHSAFTEFGRKVFSIDDESLEYYALSWKSERIRKSGSRSKDFCSGYGMSDPFEDFAECFNLYLYHNSLFRTFAGTNIVLKNKYNFIAGLLNGKYLKKNSADVELLNEWSSWRPWDTTRIN